MSGHFIILGSRNNIPGDWVMEEEDVETDAIDENILLGDVVIKEEIEDSDIFTETRTPGDQLQYETIKCEPSDVVVYTMNAKYCVAEFEDEIGLIPSKWLINSKRACRWPNYFNQAKLNRAVEAMEEPNSNWATHNIIRIFGYTDDYRDGVLKVKLAAKGSDLQNKVDIGHTTKKKRHAAKVIGTPSEDEAKEEGNDDIFKDLPSEDEAKEEGNDDIFKDLLVPSEKFDDEVQSLAAPKCTPRGEFGGDLTCPDKGFHKEYMTKLDMIYCLVKQMDAKVDRIIDSKNRTEEVHDFPIESEEEFHNVELKLKDDLFFESCVKTLLKIGGRDLQGCVWGVLRHMMTNHVAEKFSLKGAKQKKSFQDKLLFKLILEAVQLQFKTTEAELRPIIARWLVAATLRIRRQEAKQRPRV